MKNILDTIDQPILLLDEAIARRNIVRMTTKIKTAGVAFRPHFKTHQSAEIGYWFKEQGVERITVSSVEMAEYFAAAGWQDILIAFSMNIRQAERFHALAQKIHLGILVENSEAVDVLAGYSDLAADVWIKVDAGAHRTGIDWQNVDRITKLVAAIRGNQNLHLRGLLTHSGDTYHCDSTEDIVRAFRAGVDHLNDLRDELQPFGIDNLEISVGDTPGCSLCNDFSGIDELRPGNFVFNDGQQLVAGVCTTEQIAVALACPVVAIHPERNEVVIYGGAVHLSKDLIEINGVRSYGLAAFTEGERWGNPIPGAVVRSLTQEHGVIVFDDDSYRRLKVGDLLFVLPAHSCLTVNLMKKYLTLDGKVIQTMK
jgi:D-serine deaminase-like pyridoxal phosphate-dependent protein